MKARAKLGLLLGLIILLGVGLWFVFRDHLELETSKLAVTVTEDRGDVMPPHTQPSRERASTSAAPKNVQPLPPIAIGQAKESQAEERGYSIEVKDRFGNPFGDARISWRDKHGKLFTGVSNAEGTASIRAAGPITAWLSDEGEEGAESFRNPYSEEYPLGVTLLSRSQTGRGSLTITAHTKDGTPIRGLNYQIVPNNREDGKASRSVWPSKEREEFFVPHRENKNGIKLVVDRSLWASWRYSFLLERELTEEELLGAPIELIFDPPLLIKGRLVDPLGNSLADSEVQALPEGLRSERYIAPMSGRTDGNGYFAILAHPCDSFAIRSESVEYYYWIKREYAGEKVIDVGNIIVRQKVWLRLRAQIDGKPLEQARFAFSDLYGNGTSTRRASDNGVLNMLIPPMETYMESGRRLVVRVDDRRGSSEARDLTQLFNNNEVFHFNASNAGLGSLEFGKGDVDTENIHGFSRVFLRREGSEFFDHLFDGEKKLVLAAGRYDYSLRVVLFNKTAYFADGSFVVASGENTLIEPSYTQCGEVHLLVKRIDKDMRIAVTLPSELDRVPIEFSQCNTEETKDSVAVIGTKLFLMPGEALRLSYGPGSRDFETTIDIPALKAGEVRTLRVDETYLPLFKAYQYFNYIEPQKPDSD